MVFDPRITRDSVVWNQFVPNFESDAELVAGEVRTKTTVNPDREGQMRIHLALKVHAITENAFLAIRR